MVQNVVIGRPLVNSAQLFANSVKDWDENEKEITLFTEERFLPRILVAAGIAKSTTEVRKNRPELVKELADVDFIRIKWGKKFLWIAVGE
jgi:hypothetical protein